MDIPFESICLLIYRLSHPPKSTRQSQKGKPIPPDQIFASWLNHLPRPFPQGTGKRLFRCIYPHEGSRRRYGLKETKMASELERILGLKGLGRWDSVDWQGEGGTGCLGKELQLRMKSRIESQTKSTITLTELDSLLDALAASSPFSQLSQEPNPTKSSTQILTQLFRDSDLSPYALAVLTQIILRDLRPLLNPLPHLRIRNPTALLRIKSNTGPAQLELRDAMKVWDPRMRDMYEGGMGDIDRCADAVEGIFLPAGGRRVEVGSSGLSSREKGRLNGPVLGVNIQIPKCRKGRSMEDALNEFTGNQWSLPAKTIWAETKYDGYRMQIHVEVSNGQPVITVFSKSKRNSTLDRLNTHSLILSALGFPIPRDLPTHNRLNDLLKEIAPSTKRISQSIIVEAEVVPYNEFNREGNRGPGIEEFWCLQSAGVVADQPGRPKIPALQNYRVSKDRHLCLVFFDILYLEGRSLLREKYDTRRALLQEFIIPIPGFSMLAERTHIPLHLGRSQALKSLEEAFQAACTHRDEGLVLKSPESTYTQSSSNHRWVKLKKDYIPNLGDCIDLVLLGAGWDIDRARELRVDTSVLTTFYFGVLMNGDKVKAKKEVPHFEVLFRGSYGPSREELEVYNSNIRFGRWGSKCFDRDDPLKRRLIGLSWTYHLPFGIKPPSLLFERPLCAEVMGAGFQKLGGSDLYELRWPRLQKIYDPKERPWTEALSAQALIETAHQSLGYAKQTTPMWISKGSPDSSSLRALWRSSSAKAVDIPDTPSPLRPNGTPARFNRAQSAPDLFEIEKTSPPTPLRFSRMTPSPQKRNFGGSGSGSPNSGRRRVRGPLRRDDSEPELETDLDDHCGADEVNDDGDEEPTGGGQLRGMLRTPPRSSPSKRIWTSPPLFTPLKRPRRDCRDRGDLKSLGDLDLHRNHIEPPTPPTSSPVYRILTPVPLNIPSLSPPSATSGVVIGKEVQDIVAPQKPEGGLKSLEDVRRRFGKAVSLRSRIRLACKLGRRDIV